MNTKGDMAMNRSIKIALSGKFFIIVASLILCLGMSAAPALAATSNNNFTMLDAGGGFIGGTNTVDFSWDGTFKTSVVASGQVSNATIASTCLFFGQNWNAHDVAIYGPGTYTVYDGCAAGSPGCGTGNAVTFTVGAGQVGGHMLFYWNGSDNIDVVDVWETGVFAPSSMWTGICGSGNASQAWDWMSTDWDADSINGAPMTDGPFAGSNANFNLMVCGNCDDGNPCTDDSCNLTTFACDNIPNTAACADDGLICTDDVCAAGACTHPAVVCSPPSTICNETNGCDVCSDAATRCDDSNLCTTDTCNLTTGACINTNNSLACDDSDPCTTGDVCSGGTCAGAAKNCDDSNVCTTDSCEAGTGTCLHANNTLSCNDGDSSTSNDVCSNGVCSGEYVGCAGVDTTGNNFSMLDSQGATFGGTNDVRFVWDGTTLTSVAVSGQRSNASISSVTPFFGFTWATTDVAVYGPGTYTVYTGCAPGSPGCGVGTPYTFTVGAGELGAHMLFKWGAPNGSTSCGVANCDIDVVDIWTPNAVFAPSTMWLKGGGSDTNPANTVWDWMSKDWDGNGMNGSPMVDGPFVGSTANFNVMGVSGSCNCIPTEPSLVSPENGAAGLGTTVDVRWKKSTDCDAGETATLKYLVTWCTDTNDAATCKTVNPKTGEIETAKSGSKGMFYAGGAGLLMIGLTFFGGSSGRRRMVLLLLIAVLFAGGLIVSCSNDKTGDGKNLPIDEMSYEITGLSPGTTYYWHVSVDDGKSNGKVQSPAQGDWNFRTN